MSRRRSVIVGHTMEADGGVSPNEYVPVVSCEVRVFWPPLATEEQIMEAIHQATDKAIAGVLDRGDFIPAITASPVAPAPVVPGAGLGVDDSAPVVQTGDQIV